MKLKCKPEDVEFSEMFITMIFFFRIRITLNHTPSNIRGKFSEVLDLFPFNIEQHRPLFSSKSTRCPPFT